MSGVDLLRRTQRPTFELVPPRTGSASTEVIELSSRLGLGLDPWQRHVLSGATGRRIDGGFAAFDVGVLAPRQVGKTALLIPRVVLELLERSRTVVWSAHETATALEGFGYMLGLLEESSLEGKIARVFRSKGFEEIKFTTGSRVRFRARTRSAWEGVLV